MSTIINAPLTPAGRQGGNDGRTAAPPGQEDIRFARNRLIAPLIVLCLPLLVLLVAMLLRIEQFAGRLPDLPTEFSRLFASFVILMLAGLTAWAVYRASRGNNLGEKWRSGQQIAADTDAIDNSLHRQALAEANARNQALDTGAAHLIGAKDKVRRMVQSVERGRGAAAGVLGLHRVPPLGIDRELVWEQFVRVGGLLDRERERGAALDRVACVSHLAVVPTQRTAWAMLSDPTDAPPDPGLLGKNTTAQTPTAGSLFGDPTQDRPASPLHRLRRKRVVTVFVIAILIIVAAACWFILGTD